LRELEQTATYQRKLLRVAVALLKPGGHLVFSTCTINPGGLAEAVEERWAGCRLLACLQHQAD
jgi:16S rRNA C967 or C1407 C5-methylase (RsmB/RsmF family)